MGISLSGGPFSYNRFDDYESLISEKKKQGYNDREDESLGERDGKESSKKQSEKDRRDESEGEEKSKGKRKYSGTKSMDKGERWQDSDGDGKWYEKGEDVAEEKVRSAKVETEKKLEKGLDKGSKASIDEHQMSLYVRALGRMGMNYVGHPLSEGESTAERKSAADRGFEKKRQEKEGRKGEAHETGEIMKLQDKALSKEAFENGWNAAELELDEEKVKQAKKMSEKKLEKGLDKDTHSEAFDAGYAYCISEGEGAGSPGKMVASVKKEIASNKKETDSMKYNDAKQRRSQAKNAAEEFVIGHLIDEGLATNETSAEVLMMHMSDAWYEAIIAEMGPAYPSETKAQAKAQGDHREGKSSAGLKTGKNPGLKASHTSGANRQD